MDYAYFINTDERGEFNADVRDADGRTVFEITNLEPIEDGFMSNANDLDGLKDWLIDLEIIPKHATLTKGN
jgi:hypothetical protein